MPKQLNSIQHTGRISPFDRARAAQKLFAMGYSRGQIQNIVKIPVDKIERFVSDRLIRTSTGDRIVKAPIAQLPVETKSNMSNSELDNQGRLAIRSQSGLLYQMLGMLENNWFDTSDEKIISALRKIHILTKKF